MPIYSIQGPDGNTYSIEGPAGASRADVIQAIQRQMAQQRPQEAAPQVAPPPAAPSTQRTIGEAILDIPAAGLSGLGGLLQFPGQLVKLVPGLSGLGEVLEKPGELVSGAGDYLKSEGLKARQALQSKAISDAEKDGILSQFATAITSTIKDPALLTTFVAEQVPLLLGPLSAAKVAQKIGAKSIESAGAGLTGKAAEEAVRVAAQRVNKKAATAAYGTGSAMQAADVSSDAYDQAYKQAIEQGLSEDEALRVAANAGRVAGAGAGVVSLLAQRLPGAMAIEKRLAGVPGTQGRIASGFGEALGESLEEGGGQLFKNLGLRQVNPEQPLLEGVGGAAGLGALGGGLLGTALGRKAEEPRFEGQQEGESDRQFAARLQQEIAAGIRPPAPPAPPPQEPPKVVLPGDQQLFTLAAQPNGYGMLENLKQRLIENASIPEDQKKPVIENIRSIQERMNIETVDRLRPMGQPPAPLLPTDEEAQQKATEMDLGKLGTIVENMGKSIPAYQAVLADPDALKKQAKKGKLSVEEARSRYQQHIEYINSVLPVYTQVLQQRKQQQQQAKEAEKAQEVANLTPEQQAIRSQAESLINELEGSGIPEFVGLVRGSRYRLANNEIKTEKDLEFLKSKVESYRSLKQSSTTGKPVDQISLEYLNRDYPEDQERLQEASKDPRLADLFARVNDVMNRGGAAVNALGMSWSSINNSSPIDVKEVGDAVNSLAGGVSRLSRIKQAIDKNYDRATNDPARLEKAIAETEADIETANQRIAKVQALAPAAAPTAPPTPPAPPAPPVQEKVKKIEGPKPKGMPVRAKELPQPPAPVTQEQKDIKSKVAEIERDIRKEEIKRRSVIYRSDSLFKFLKNKLNQAEVNDVSTERQFKPLVRKDRRGDSISTFVANGDLDPWLPPDRRLGMNNYDEYDNTEYIKDLLRGGKATDLTFDAKSEVERIYESITALERSIKDLVSVVEANEAANTAREEQRGVAEETGPTAAEVEDQGVAPEPILDEEGRIVRKSLAKVTQGVPPGKFRELERRAKAAPEPKAEEPKAEEPKPEEPKAEEPKPTISPEIQKKIETLGRVLQKNLAKFGLKGIDLNLEQGMADEGSFSGQLIRIALDAQDPLGILRHESIHALKEANFFTDKQWATLERMADQQWIDQYLKGQQVDYEGQVMSRYDAYMKEYAGNMALIREEAIADAFRNFSKKQPAGLMGALTIRMKNFFKAVKSAFNSQGFESAEDIFGKIEEGKLEAAAPVKAEGVERRASLRTSDIQKISKAPEAECFSNARKYASDNDEPGTFVVHGKVNDINGKVIDHAWVERNESVIDPTAGVIVPKNVYYPQVSAVAESVYTPEQASINSVRTGNQGPWTAEEVGGRIVERKSLRGAEPEDLKNSLSEMRISPRYPTAAKATEDPMGDVRLQPDLNTFKQNRQSFIFNVGLMNRYPNFRGMRGSADDRVEQMILQMQDNLTWLYNHWKPNFRERSRLWYVGGNRISHRWAKRYDMPPEKVAGVIAALSPQKGWFANVSIAERMLDAVVNNADTKWDDSMSDVLRNREWGNKLSKVLKYSPVEQLARFEGKTLREIYRPGDQASLLDMAVWIRAWDEAKNPQVSRVITPEGRFTNDLEMTEDGSRPMPLRAQGFGPMTRALMVLQARNREDISLAIGDFDKVRSFYNNIISPYNNDDVTIDTHAVAAALLRPLGSSDLEVSHNFGSAPEDKSERAMSNSSITGLHGSYSVYAEAYRRAARDLGVLPRELQSITWEAVRGLFRPGQKVGAKERANQIWRQVASGAINANEARREISKLVGGIEDPAWTRSPVGSNEAARDSSYQGKLPGVGQPGRPEGRGGELPAGTQVERKSLRQPMATWTDKRIDGLINEYGYTDGRTKAYAASVDPADFVLATTGSRESAEKIYKEAGKLDFEELSGEIQTPFLFIETSGKYWKIVGHEGRHRMAALSQEGITKVPVVLVMYENGSRKPSMYEQKAPMEIAGQDFGMDVGIGYDLYAWDLIPLSYKYKEKLKEKHSSGDIRFSLRSKIGLYSELENKVEGVSAKAAPAGQWKAMINALTQKGVKPEEIEWSGVNDWLDLQEGRVSKDDLLNYLRENGVQVRETVLGDKIDLFEKYLAARRKSDESGNSTNIEFIQKLPERARSEEEQNLLDAWSEYTEGGLDAKFGSYTLPGGENYREVLLTLPANVDAETQNLLDQERYLVLTPEQQAKVDAAKKKAGVAYRSRHWDQSNVIAHIRVNDRTDADGNKVLFVEEIQSDWGQEGKKRGFYDPKDVGTREEYLAAKSAAADVIKRTDNLGFDFWANALNAIRESAPNWRNNFSFDSEEDARIIDDFLLAEARELRRIGRGQSTGIPAAPFVTKTEGWLNLALKRIMVMAAEGGYDKVAFVNGEQSADRYDLSKQVSRVRVHRDRLDENAFGPWVIQAEDSRGNNALEKEISDLDEVENYIGKEVAQRLIEKLGNGNDASISGLDLKVGGEGMKTFYDQIVPLAIRKLLSKTGGKEITEVDIGETRDPYDLMKDARRESGMTLNQWERLTSAEKQKVIEDYRKSLVAEKQIGFDVTPAMREKVETTGLPKFSLRSRPFVDPVTEARIDATIIAAPRESLVDRMIDAISPKTFSRLREEFIVTYNELAEVDKRVAAQIRAAGGKEQLADERAESAALLSDQAAAVASSALGAHNRKGGIPVYRNGIVTVDTSGDNEGPVVIFSSLASTGDPKTFRDYQFWASVNRSKKYMLNPGQTRYVEQVFEKDDIDRAEQLRRDYAAQGIDFNDIRSRWLKYNNGLVKLMRDTGGISDRAARDFVEHADYFPFFRQIGEEDMAGPKAFSTIAGTKPPKAAKGGEAPLGDFFETVVRNTQAAITLAMKNVAAQRATSQALRINEVVRLSESPQIVQTSATTWDVMDSQYIDTVSAADQAAAEAIARRKFGPTVTVSASTRAGDWNVFKAVKIGDVDAADAQEARKLAYDNHKYRPDINVYKVLEHGQPVYYRAADIKFINAIKALNMADLPFIGLLSAPSNLLRTLVTKDPGYMLVNQMRDSLSAWQTSGVKMTPFIDSARQFAKSVAKTSPEMEALFNAGVIGGYEYAHGQRESGKFLEKEIRRKAGVKSVTEKITTPFTSLWGALERGTQVSDGATRAEVYKRVLAETGNEAEAIWQAAEVLNFYRHGRNPIIRVLTAAVPFLNSRIQGLDVLYRAGMRPAFDKMATDEQRKRMKTFWVRGMTMFATTFMYWLLTHDDDEYKKQEQETRDNYWLIPSLGIKIAIPFEVGVIFKVLPERLFQSLAGNDTAKDTMDSLKRQLESTLMFSIIPQAVAPYIEVTRNFSSFTQRPIIGQGLENVAPRFQVAPGTSSFAQVVANTLQIETTADSSAFTKGLSKSLEISPVKLDHLIKGYTGTLGQYAVEVFDAIYNLNADVPKPSKRFEQLPVIKRLALDPNARGNVTAYYDLKNAVDEVVRTSNLLERTMNYDAYAPYLRANIGLLANKQYISALEKSMKEFREMKILIRNSKMDSNAKEKAILAVEQMENQLTSNIQQVKVAANR